MQNIRRNFRKDRRIIEKQHDTYMEKLSIPEPSLCSDCNALFENGRWTWNTTEKRANTIMCPACKRKRDNYPAGFIELNGQYYHEKNQEIMNLINNIEIKEKNDHPLERIMKIQNNGDKTLITTTGIHVARRIGEAISKAHKGNYRYEYPEGEKIIRVYWDRKSK